MPDESRRGGWRMPKGLLAVVVSALVSVGGGGGTAWLVSDVKLAWLRADLEKAERRLEHLERRDVDAVRFQAEIGERVNGVRAELTLLRSDAAAMRALLEGLRWGRR